MASASAAQVAASVIPFRQAIRHPEVKSLVLLVRVPLTAEGRQFLRGESTTAPEFFAAADDDEFPGTVLTMEWILQHHR